MFRLGSFFAVAACLSACLSNAGTKVEIPELARQMRENELAAYAKYQGKLLEVSGVIRGTGVEAGDTVSAETNHGPISDVSTLNVDREHYPFVLITDAKRRDASVLCYFRPSAMEELSSLRLGDPVTVSGRLDDHMKGEHLRFILVGCELRD